MQHKDTFFVKKNLIVRAALHLVFLPSVFKNILFHSGKYILFLGSLFYKPEKLEVYRRQILREMYDIGVGSFGIVSIISVFLGAVITIQTAHNLFSKFVPLYVISIVTRDSIIIEFAPTVIGLVLAGKVGSSIASELGTMRVSEQVDALEVMGINASGFLVLPKIIAAMIVVPFLILAATLIGIIGGLVGGTTSGVISYDEYIRGLQTNFLPFNVTFGIIKSITFAFLMTSVPAYHGFFTSGGAYEVGESSTRGVVYCSILILLFDLILTQMLLI